MERQGVNSGDRICYYSLLGIRKDASSGDIRSAYRKQAMKWHPDKWTTGNQPQTDEANRRFQEIQQAYSVLSDQGKKSLYDAGLYDPLDEDDEDFGEFVDEMIDMMGKVKNEGENFEDLQKMFKDIFSGDEMMFGFNGGSGGFEMGAVDPAASKRARSNPSQKMQTGMKRANTRA